MTNTIRIPAQCVVLVVGGRKAPFAQVADAVPQSTASPFDVQKPDASIDRLHAALDGGGIVRVCMPHANAKARRSVASAAHRRGARCICLMLPDSPTVDAEAEKIDAVHDVPSLDGLVFEIVPMPSDRTDLAGPFTIIGDVHGCADELMELLRLTGHVDEHGELKPHPEGRVPVLLGDLTDRGPRNLLTLEIARRLADLGGIVVRGNHDDKLIRWLRGKNVLVQAGLEITIRELDPLPAEWKADMADWLDTLQSHVMLDGGRLAVAHAGISEEHQGRHTGGAFSFGLYGSPKEGGTELDEYGYPLREDWAATYRGSAVVVHGHEVHPEPRVLNNVVAIDTGCVVGGSLTAYLWPEREFVSVPARETYFARKPETAAGEEIQAGA